jgi:hypothetical protein
MGMRSSNEQHKNNYTWTQMAVDLSDEPRAKVSPFLRALLSQDTINGIFMAALG